MTTYTKASIQLCYVYSKYSVVSANFFYINLTFTLLEDKKSLFRITSILILVNKQVFSWYQIFYRLFSSEKLANTILSILKCELLILCMPILVSLDISHDFAIKKSVIVLTLLPELSKALILQTEFF